MIDPTARVDPAAQLADDVEVGPWTLIGPGVEIGSGTRIGSHCVLKGPTVIGPDNTIAPFCSIGDDPQDKKFDPGGSSRLEIGRGNTIREYCSINRGTALGGGVTRVGNDNWIMAYCHVAHDCRIGDHTVFANNATLAGHVEIDDYVILGGFTGVHQFCRLGEGSFSAISAVIVRDVPPFVTVDGNTARPRSINREGLRRRGVGADAIAALKRCYRALYRQGRTLEDALEVLEAEAAGCAEVERMLAFIRESQRGIVR
ncbi:MAG: acyl-ACP--UDP-N-acetylglucosamine O-acyltransferase [Gammaproteobacteria bacterium]